MRGDGFRGEVGKCDETVQLLFFPTVFSRGPWLMLRVAEVTAG